jgi:hypothetical protein
VLFGLSSGAAIATLLLWPISQYWGISYTRAYPDRDWLGRRTGRSFCIAIKESTLSMGTTGRAFSSGLDVYPIRIANPSRRLFRPTYGKWGKEWHLAIPVWYFAIFCGIVQAVLWRRVRGVPYAGCCRNCHYNLTGNRSGVCPECGKIIGDARRSIRRRSKM